MKDGIFDDVLALKQPSAMWPRPSPVGAPSARGNVLRQRRLKCAFPWPCPTAEHDSSLHAVRKGVSALPKLVCIHIGLLVKGFRCASCAGNAGKACWGRESPLC